MSPFKAALFIVGAVALSLAVPVGIVLALEDSPIHFQLAAAAEVSILSLSSFVLLNRLRPHDFERTAAAVMLSLFLGLWLVAFSASRVAEDVRRQTIRRMRERYEPPPVAEGRAVRPVAANDVHGDGPPRHRQP